MRFEVHCHQTALENILISGKSFKSTWANWKPLVHFSSVHYRFFLLIINFFKEENLPSLKKLRFSGVCFFLQNPIFEYVQLTYWVSSNVPGVESAKSFLSSSPVGISSGDLYPTKNNENFPWGKSSCFKSLKFTYNDRFMQYKVKYRYLTQKYPTISLEIRKKNQENKTYTTGTLCWNAQSSDKKGKFVKMSWTIVWHI